MSLTLAITHMGMADPAAKPTKKLSNKPKDGVLDTSSEIPLPQDNATNSNATPTPPTTPDPADPPEDKNAKLALHIFVARLDPATGQPIVRPNVTKEIHLLEPDDNKQYQPRTQKITTTGLLEGTLYLGIKESGIAKSDEGMMTLAPIVGLMHEPALQGSFVDTTVPGSHPLTFTASVHGTGLDMTLPNGDKSYEIIIDITQKGVHKPGPDNQATQVATPTGSTTAAATPAQTTKTTSQSSKTSSKTTDKPIAK